MRTLRVRFAVMLATAAVVPLLTYGAVSLYSLSKGTRLTVEAGNLNVARQVAEQVRRYISTNLQILQALAADLENTNLTPEQTDRILKNYVLRFPEFRELTVVDGSGSAMATSRLGPPDVLKAPEFKELTSVRSRLGAAAGGTIVDGVRMSPVFVDGDMLPTTLVAAPLGRGQQQAGWLVGEFSIEELWRMVGRIRIGTWGYALVLGPGGELLAHGNPEERSRVATDALARTQGGGPRGSDPTTNAIVDQLRTAGRDQAVVREDERPTGGRLLAVGVGIPDLGWTVVVSQPTREANAVAERYRDTLVAAISLALVIMILVGSVWGRSLITPITALIKGTQAIAEGRLDERVAIESKSELGSLGAAFNGMADRLVELQDNVRKQERHAMFGRVAAGLVHDLSHPFKNVQNNCRLMLKMHDDPEYREMFRRTVDREFGTIKRVFEDLRNIARPMPLEHFPLDVNTLVADIGESMRANADTAGVALSVELGSTRLYILGDMFALGRVCRNLVLNAIEATPPQGSIVMTTAALDGKVQIRVADTGCGIPPERIVTMFEDFATTKRQGLGLGLAIVKKIVEQLGGTVSASSEVGRGTTFVLEFGRISPPEAAG
ncbi:MAG: sensor histidine kinase [Acidobacteria bacterium]|jgi:signal transduction histidine kinase|nr:sensor histidine kinase [Acidobacteriota bacterium]